MILTTRIDRSQGPVIHLLIQLTAPATHTRPPLNLAAIVDRSGSMHGPKLDHTKHALLFLVDQTAEADRLAIITYDDTVQTIHPSQPIPHKDPLKAKLARIDSGGMTNLSGGLATGMQQIAPHGGPDRLSRALLMTDGLANVGVTDPETLLTWVKTWRQRGLGLSTLGVGDDFNEDLLVAMAEAGGGNFHYIANPDQIPAIFAQELDGLLQVAAQSIQLTISTEPGVAIDGGGTRVTLTLPDLYGGEVKSILISLHVAALPPSGNLAKLTLSYIDTAPATLTAEVTTETTADPAEVIRQLNLLEAATAREEAVQMADRGDLQGGARRLAQAAVAMEALAVEGDAYAAEQVASLRTQAEALQKEQYDKAARKQLRQDSFQARRGRS
ncbi:MAG TPA: VWA domain-containing protein [Symbiobacteriaceae bacterium]|nr:VWA domain-containing protein [Symbiobacteriaceae bacterium]